MMSLMLRDRTYKLNVIIGELKFVKKIERVKTHLSKCSKNIKLDKQAKASTSQNQASNAAATLVVDDESSDSDNPPIETN